MTDPLSVAAATKNGQTVMVFVDIRGEPTEDERDLITQLWELNMINAFNIEAQRFPIATNRYALNRMISYSTQGYSLFLI